MAAFVGQLVERSLPAPKIRSSNPVIGNVICYVKTILFKQMSSLCIPTYLPNAINLSQKNTNLSRLKF